MIISRIWACTTATTLQLRVAEGRRWCKKGDRGAGKWVTHERHPYCSTGACKDDRVNG